MKNSKQIISKLSKPIASIALHMGKSTINSACFGWYHQPRVPEAMEQFKRK